MKTSNPKTEFVKIKDLHLIERNPRNISKEKMADLMKSIKENPKFFWARPVLANNKSGNNVVYAGNQRLKASKALGMTEVPCLVETLSKKEERQRMIRDNVEMWTWDFGMLKEDFTIEELGEWGVEMPEVEILPAEGETDPNAVPEVPKKNKTVLGDIYQLGGHRLLCGDSTILADAEKLMKGELADGVWTDPPYNVDYEGSDGQKIKNDKMKNDKFLEFLTSAFTSMFLTVKPGGGVYIAHADTEGFNFRNAFKTAGFKLSGCLIWKKPSLVLGRSDYQWQHEPILYGWKEGQAHQWFGGRKNTTIVGDGMMDPIQVQEDGSVIVQVEGESVLIKGENVKITTLATSMIDNEKPKRSKEHPTMKPTELIIKMLTNSTKGGDTVLDLFGGFGSTLIACEQIQRNARLIELDEKYCDVIVQRWLNFTGADEFTLNGKIVKKSEWGHFGNGFLWDK